MSAQTHTYKFKYQTIHSFSSPARDHRFILRILPQNDGRQHITRLNWRVTPKARVWKTKDGFANAVIAGVIENSHDTFRFSVSGTADILSEPYIQSPTLPPAVLRYPAALTCPCEKLMAFYNQTAAAAPPRQDAPMRFFHFANAVHNKIRYERGITDPHTTAAQAFELGLGVCQDYAHILLVLLRLDGTPCRYVAGLASDYGETHAWVEAWDGARYIGLDPTRDKFIDTGYIALSRGRDFEDCSVERGVFKGVCRGFQTVSLSLVSI